MAGIPWQASVRADVYLDGFAGDLESGAGVVAVIRDSSGAYIARFWKLRCELL